MTVPTRSQRRAFRAHLRERQPGFGEAARADLRAAGGRRGPVLALLIYRARARLHALRVPLLPRILQRAAIATHRVYIGDPVVIEPGIRVTAGPVVIDGITEIGSGTEIGPNCTIGLATGELRGPRIGRDVVIGAGAKIIGPVRVGDAARIEPGSVVVGDVEAGVRVAGLPARPARER